MNMRLSVEGLVGALFLFLLVFFFFPSPSQFTAGTSAARRATPETGARKPTCHKQSNCVTCLLFIQIGARRVGGRKKEEVKR